MKNNLRKYFPMIKTREEVLDIINRNRILKQKFQKFTSEIQDDFLDFCSGAKGVKILYDSFFKEVLNPEYTPERLEMLLSVLLGMKVRIVKILPIDSTRIGEETSLVVMDILVELEDGSLVNVEMQKIGYMFPGQRSACYSADLLLRQYKRVRSKHEEKKTKFKYSDIKPVYTIVFFEKSPTEFHDYPNQYIHYFQQMADTGLEIELLQKYIFIPLDIFCKKDQNKSIESELEAWLTFLSSDNVEDIILLIEKYPVFKPLYETLYQMCENIERVMGMFSEELYELDRNTFLFMVDEYERRAEESKRKAEESKRKAEESERKAIAFKEKYDRDVELLQETVEVQKSTIAALMEENERLKSMKENK